MGTLLVIVIIRKFVSIVGVALEQLMDRLSVHPLLFVSYMCDCFCDFLTNDDQMTKCGVAQKL